MRPNRDDRDGLFIQVFKCESGAVEQLPKRLLRRKLPARALGPQNVDLLRYVNDLKIPILGEGLQGRAQVLGGNVGRFPDGGMNIVGHGLSADAKSKGGGSDAQTGKIAHAPCQA